MELLGKLEKITDLRSVWKHEAHDFTKWLAEEDNLKLLSESIGIDIELEETESSVGDFNVDIFAHEEGSNRRIIIENQLEDTNHDHLGKLITYASGKGADLIIWIVKRARDEHRQAIEWLNQHTDDQVGFFLVEIELWRINDSMKAPKFNIVERPNDWAKTIKATEGLGNTKRLQLEFWSQFKDNASTNSEFVKAFSLRKPNAHHWYDLSLGSAEYQISLTFNTQKKLVTASLYIHENKDIFYKLKDQKEQVLNILQNKEVEFHEADKISRITISKNNVDSDNTDSWKDAFYWLYTSSLNIRELSKLIK